MIDTMLFRVNGTEKRLSEMSNQEIEDAMEDCYYSELIDHIKYLSKVVREQHHIILALEELLHEDMRKEDWES